MKVTGISSYLGGHIHVKSFVFMQSFIKILSNYSTVIHMRVSATQLRLRSTELLILIQFVSYYFFTKLPF
jgi:hypothetical protein